MRRRPRTTFVTAAVAIASLALLSPLLLTPPPPASPEDLCALFAERPNWYRHAREAARRWTVDEPLMLAVIHQESGFSARARPPRRRLLGFIPWRRPSSAFGYAQVVDGTWEQYEAATGHSAERHRFAHAVDFVGWYLTDLSRTLDLAADDAKNLYLAYHEGPGGFGRGSYRGQATLLSAADRLVARSQRYREQLGGCRGALDRRLLLRRVLAVALGLLALSGLVLALRWRWRSRR